METTSLWSCMYLLIVVYSLLVYFLTVYSYDMFLSLFVFILSLALFSVSFASLVVCPHNLFHTFVLFFALIYSLLIIVWTLLGENKLCLFVEPVVRWASISIAAIFALLFGMSISQFPIAL